MSDKTTNCQNCHATMPLQAAFCASCGVAMQQLTTLQQVGNNQQPEPPPQDNKSIHPKENVYDTAIARAAIGNNADYYIRIFKEMSANGNSAVWNWSAFVLCWIWMLYRGMPKMGIIFAGIYFTSMLLSLELPILTILTPLICSTVSGIFGNSWYKNVVDEKLRRSSF